MPFRMERNDITRVKADAIVNAANEQLRHGGGVCGAIFKAAGARRLQAACNKIGYCPTGQSVATPAFDLPARHIIHAVGPIWRGGDQGEEALLASCYRTSLELARQLKCQSIAFPLISAGIYGYPRRQALEVARREILAFLENNEMDVTLVLFDASTTQAGNMLAADLRMRLERYIDDVYVEQSGYARRRPWEGNAPSFAPAYGETTMDAAAPMADADDTGAISLGSASPAPSAPPSAPPAALHSAARSSEVGRVENAAPAHEPHPSPVAQSRRRMGLPRSLKNLLAHMDAGFSETLLALIDERGLKDAQVYKRANISRQHFSKMRSNRSYKPTKTTVLALAVALELSLDETSMLLERAGFALSHADQRDIIVEFFIREGTYDIFRINETLFAYDQPLLG